MSEIARQIYDSNRVTDADGNSYELDSQVDPGEGRLLFDLVSQDPSIVRTLEVGCAYGLSSLHICEALRHREHASHTIIDPNQLTAWHGIGVHNLERADINFFHLIDEPSELALPNLLRSGGDTYDLIFIDGWHTFDHTLVDLFFADRLLRVGGLIVVDDCDRVTVAKAVSYFTNYPNYELVRAPAIPASSTSIGKVVRALLPPRIARHLLPSNGYDNLYLARLYPSMVALRKTALDTRDWRWYRGF